MARKSDAPATFRGSNLTISFGLVNVPVRTEPLVDSKRPVGGHMTCPEHEERVQMRSLCGEGTDHEHLLGRGETVTAYPVPGEDRLVQVDAAVLEELVEERTGVVTLERVVDVSEIDPVYFEKSYLVDAREGGHQAFDLLVELLRRSGKAGVASIVLSKQTRLVVVRWSEATGTLVMHVCVFDERIRWADVEKVRDARASRGTPNKATLTAAGPLVEALNGSWDASEVEDTYSTLLAEAVQVAAGKKIIAPAKKAAPQAEVGDLMAQLEASVAAAKPKKTKKKTRAAA